MQPTRPGEQSPRPAAVAQGRRRRIRFAGTPAREALEGALTAIAAAGVQTPRMDAELLLAHVLGVPRERLFTEAGLRVEGRAVRALQDAVRRRAVEREFDAVLANLPYVAESERAELAPEILRHEPPGALFAGPDGLSAIRELLDQIASRERIELVALEVGAGQAQAVCELTRAAGFRAV